MTTTTTTTKYIKPGYKQTPLGILPKDWEVNTLEELLDFKNGVNASKDSYGEGAKFINVLEIINNDYLYNEIIPGTVSITDKQFQNYKVERGDVLFNRTSETQDEVALTSVYLDDAPSVFGGFVIRGRFKEDVYLNEFKKYLFHNPDIRKQIISKGQGAVRVNIGQTDLGKVYVPVLVKDEQKQIASCLTTWDQGIEKLSTLIEAKKEQKKGLMQGLFNGQMTVVNGQLIQAKEGEDFRGNWNKLRLGNAARVQGGYAFKSDKFQSEGTPIIRISNLSAKTSKVDFTDVVYYSKINQSNFKVYKGDLLIAMSGATTGKTAIYTRPNYAYLNQRVGLFKSKNDKKLDYRILYYIVQTNYFDNEIRKMLSTGAQPNISSSDIENIKLNLPPFEEQRVIADVLVAADKEIVLLEQRMETMQLQKKGLMQVLLTGKKRLIENQ